MRVFDEEEAGSNFMSYFLVLTVLCIAGYIIYHNKQKVTADLWQISLKHRLKLCVLRCVKMKTQPITLINTRYCKSINSHD